MTFRQKTPAQAELVEALSFSAFHRKKGQALDKLRLSGLWVCALILLPACSSLFAKSPEQQYEAATEAWREGRVREARIALMNALQAEPGHKHARLLQARIALEAGDGVAGEAELARARQAGAVSAETRHLMAHARLLQSDLDGALQQAEATAPEHASHAARIVGLAELRRGDRAAALRAFDRAVALDPGNSYAWLDLARYRRGAGDAGLALVATDRAVAANPNHAAGLVLRGELTRQQYGLAAAIPWFDRALEVDAGNVTALLERAATYGDMGRMTAMLADARAASALDPGHPLPYFLQATLAARGRDFDLARSLLARTRGAYDGIPSGMLLAAVIAYHAQDYEDAARRLTPLVAQQPGNVKARRLLAASRLALNEPAAAIDALRPIANRPDADSYTLTLVAEALDRQRNRPLAASFRARAAAPEAAARSAYAWSNATDPEVRAIGELLVARDFAAAFDRARRLQAATPGAAHVHLLAGDVRGAAGDHRGAAEEYRRAANLAFTEASAIRLIGALTRAGDAAAADAVLHLFAAQHPRNLSAQRMLAARALAAGEFAEAAARYELLRARIGNGDAALLNNLAWAYAGAGDPDRAAAFARRAWALAPANGATATTLGWALFREGRTAEGLSLIVAARRGRAGELVAPPTQTASR